MSRQRTINFQFLIRQGELYEKVFIDHNKHRGAIHNQRV